MNKIKIILDIVMTCLMILLMKINITGLVIHEIVGISIFILFIIHKVLNFKFIKAIGKNIFSKKLKFNSKIMFWLDVILLLFMTINVFSGILISKFIFSFLNISHINTLTIIHKCFAWWTLILIAIHIGFHLEFLANFLKKKFNIQKSNYAKVILLLSYLIIAILGIKSLTKYSIYTKLVPINRTNKVSYNYNEKNEEEIPTLDEYLSQFHCDGCRKQCSLLNPKCEVGRNKREEKINEYYEKYDNNKNQDLEKREEKNNRKCKNKSSISDVIYIMILFAGASYCFNLYLNNKNIMG